MQGKIGYIEIPVERSVDIDGAYDSHIAELLIKYPFPNK